MTHGPTFVYHVRFINLIYTGINNKISKFPQILIPFTTKFHQTGGIPWRITSMAESNLKDHNSTQSGLHARGLWLAGTLMTAEMLTAHKWTSRLTTPPTLRICTVICDGFMNACKLHACLHHGDYISWNPTTQHFKFSLNLYSRMVTIRTPWFYVSKICTFLMVYFCVPHFKNLHFSCCVFVCSTFKNLHFSYGVFVCSTF